MIPYCIVSTQHLARYRYSVSAVSHITTCQYFKQYYVLWKFEPALPWYWTPPLSIIILSYLLAFVQPTWQVARFWLIFYQFLIIFFIEFINIGLVYIRRWVRGLWGWGGWWQKLKQRSKMAQMVEFWVVMPSTCIHKGSVFHHKA